MKELKKIINTVLTNRGKQIVKEIDLNTNLRTDIGFDSLDLAELTVRIEAKYDVDVFEDGVVNTIGDILLKIKSE